MAEQFVQVFVYLFMFYINDQQQVYDKKGVQMSK